jgi:hypothetical protein
MSSNNTGKKWLGVAILLIIATFLFRFFSGGDYPTFYPMKHHEADPSR